LLQAAWEVTVAWQAGGGAADLTAKGPASTAVVAALSFWDYSAMLPAGTNSDAHKTSGRCFSVAAGRISYVQGFKGGHWSRLLLDGHHVSDGQETPLHSWICQRRRL
jgi:acyl transferase domain-containing protein